MIAQTEPVVSVVTGVYNAGRYLRSAAESILSQEGVPWEWVIVDDGSTDGSSRVLQGLAQADSRVRVICQENQGLTSALILGCSVARGRYIARHDADDLSLPGRLSRQANLLDADPSLAFVSCRSRLIGPEGELLVETNPALEPGEATAQLRNHTNGPCHGSVMFRAEAYRLAGGYRAQFRFAQDWDLWLRLSEIGKIRFASDFLYAFRVSAGSISSHRRVQQARLAEIARRCADARANGLPQDDLLLEAARVSVEPPVKPATSAASNAYFIGKCLFDRRDRRAVPYLWQSISQAPVYWRPWGVLAAAYLLCREQGR